MLRKNYLVDHFYGQDSLFSHYHYPGEGNIRGFVGQGEQGAEALIAFSNELIISYPDIYNISADFALFSDVGTFFSRNSFQNIFELPQYKGSYITRIYADAGLGLRLSTSFFEKDLHIRFDMPFLLYDDRLGSRLNRSNWIFSFQRSF